jgi:prephenate dehydrogenase
VRTLAPREHDEIVALVSHLPHLLAAALVNATHAQSPAAADFCGNGFRDTTRVASGPPAMWAEIFEQNREPLKKSVNAMIEKLREFVTLLDSANPRDLRAVEQFLADAKTERDRLKISQTSQ